MVLLYTISCTNNSNIRESGSRDTIFVHDTILNNDIPHCVTYNLPCKIENININNKGKAILVFWLHGGVRDQKAHSLLNASNNHIDQWRNKAYNAILAYLHNSDTKAIYVAPICHKAEIPNCVSWIDCANDIKQIIDDYVNAGIVDPDRVYLAGCSDGGAGAWDFAVLHQDWFAAAMPFSCSNPRMTSIPIYYSSTKAEGDKSYIVNELNSKGANIKYKFHPDENHGGDEKMAQDTLYLKSFFSNSK